MATTMNLGGNHKLASYTLTALINVFLGLVVAKLLDTLLSSLEKPGKFGLEHWYCFSAMTVILLYAFILFFKVSVDEVYAAVFQSFSNWEVGGLLAAILSILVLLYMMAFWFGLGTGRYAISSCVLAGFYVIFDYFFLRAMTRSGPASADCNGEYRDGKDLKLARVIEAAKAWMMCDILLTMLLFCLLWDFHKRRLSASELTFAIMIVFAAINFIVARFLDAESEIANADDLQAMSTSMLPNGTIGIRN